MLEVLEGTSLFLENPSRAGRSVLERQQAHRTVYLHQLLAPFYQESRADIEVKFREALFFGLQCY